MNQAVTAFTTIKSTNEKFQIKVGKPTNAMLNVMVNFNVFAYMEFVGILECLPYLNVKGMHTYDDGTSGIGIELVGTNSLSQLIEELPEILYLYVENAKPGPVVHKGRLANEETTEVV